MPTQEASLYIHIPFCASLCDYCDFYSVTAKSLNDDYIRSFLSALIIDIKSQIDFFSVKEIPTVYIGGGTPSVLGKSIGVLFDALKTIPFFSPVEFTIEANPESLTEGFLDACMAGGVNRLSLGVQTFHEPSRIAVNRMGDSRVIQKRLALIRQFPFALSFDLITGLPCQNEKIILDDIKHVLDFAPAHISLYSLTIEDNTPLEDKIKNKTVNLPDRDLSDSLWLAGRGALLNAGFEHYEISNFARNVHGSRCLHNIRYWQMQNWLGAGPSASGTIVNEKEGSAERFTLAPDTDVYIKEILSGQTAINNALLCNREEIKKNVFLKENLLMGFRYAGGAESNLFKQRFGVTIEDCIPKTLEKWKEKNKMLFLNQFLSEAFEEIDYYSAV